MGDDAFGASWVFVGRRGGSNDLGLWSEGTLIEAHAAVGGRRARTSGAGNAVIS